jgi:hypothetical protein
MACCLVLLTAATACHSPDDYLLSPSRLDQVLNVTLSATTIPADGVSVVTITAQLDRRTDADKRSVTFTTTAGTLIAGGSEGASITIQADSAGTATAELRSSTTTATARLQVTVGSVSRTASVAFLGLPREELFEASLSRASVPADGFSTTVITVTLRRPGTLLQRAVRFETSLGTFIAPGQPNSRAVTLTAETTGRVAVDLQSEKTVGVARVRVTAVDIPYEFDVTFSPVDPAQIITVSVAPPSGPADGVTPLIISAAVAAGLPAGRRTVTFRSTVGQLIPTTLEADGSDIARASLVSTITGVARITATVDGTTAETTAQFTASLPDRLHLALDAAELKSGGSTSVRATLVRESGSIGPRLQVTYSARTVAGVEVGSFSRVTLAEDGISTATFNVGTTTYLGPVTVFATAEGGATGTATVLIVP